MSSRCPERCARAARGAVALLAPLALAACDPREPAPSEERDRLSLAPLDTHRLQPGPKLSPEGVGGPKTLSGRNPYEGNIYAEAEGLRLYRWMNCVNCHGQGGGSIGPALWDDEWRYGGSPASVAESIVRGRPNGMPAFGGRLTEEQVWQLVTYVRALRPGGSINRAGRH